VTWKEPRHADLRSEYLEGLLSGHEYVSLRRFVIIFISACPVGGCLVLWGDSVCYAGGSISVRRSWGPKEFQENNQCIIFLCISLLFKLSFIFHCPWIFYCLSAEDNGSSIQDPWLCPHISRLQTSPLSHICCKSVPGMPEQTLSKNNNQLILRRKHCTAMRW